MNIDIVGEKGCDGERMVMNDGCARISPAMARLIVEKLGLDYSPCAFQGRFGSAKGMWVVDVTKDEWNSEEDANDVWIETYPSQRKWDCDYEDEHQRTFEVRDYAPASIKPASVNTQLLPVLEHGALNKDAMRGALGELTEDSIGRELAKQEVAMRTPNECLLWITQLRRSAESRLEAPISDTNGADSFGALLGSFPNNSNDQIAFLAQHGFHPQKQKYIQDLAKQVREDHCGRMSEELKFEIGCSAYFFMLADMWGVLEEGEIHLCFSEPFQDELRGFNDTSVDGCDVLVARSPAHLPSDVQRAKAVYCHKLRKLKNVIVFSAKGVKPLADKLSGGDYDGDLAWVCWDPKIVNNFSNTDVPGCPSELVLKKNMKTYGNLLGRHLGREHPQKRATCDMVREGLEFNCKGSLLGLLTTYKEQLCYHMGTIANAEAIFMSHLLGLLVDQPKQGVLFDMTEWTQLRKSIDPIYQGPLPEPAFKNPNLIEWPNEWPDPQHISDFLKFVVARAAIDKGRTRFNELLDPNATYGDDDVTARYDSLTPLLPEVEKNLRSELYKLHRKWDYKCASIGPEWRRMVRDLHWEYQQIGPRQMEVEDERLSEVLQSCGTPGHVTLSEWALFKASVLFKISWSKPKYGKKFIWHMCGRELGVIKARASGSSVSITSSCHSIMKPNKKAVARQTGMLIGMGEFDID